MEKSVLSGKKSNQNIHIILLIIGAIYLASGAFHNGLWFDESYTVGLINHDMISMCKIATHDVHPHLYYILLKLFTYIFGEHIITLRLFSVLGCVLLSVLGYTHIRKDFDEKTGFWFSFLVIFMSSTFKYASQIRMYTWAPLLVMLACIYAYRMLVYVDKQNKNSILFVIFSVMSAYTHYYALVAVGILNLIILVHFIIKKKHLLRWFTMAIIQLLLYIPGFYVFIIQSKLGGASWINVKYPNIIFDTISFHFVGVPQTDISTNSPTYIICLLFGLLFYCIIGYFLYRLIKNKNDKRIIVVSALIIYFGVILCFLAISIFRPIYYVRYSIVSYGLLLFSFAYIFANINRNSIKFTLAVILVGLSLFRATDIYITNYDNTNDNIDKFLESNIQPGDILVFDDFSAFSIAVKYQNIPTYFYNKNCWGIEDAYKAFGDNVIISRTLDELDSYKGRIWVIGKGEAYRRVRSYFGIKEISNQYIQYHYYNNSKDIILIEK